MANSLDFRKLSAFIFIVILFFFVVLILKPIALAVITGLLVAYILYPVYLKILYFVKEKNLSALIVVILVFLVLFLPLWFLFPIITKQIFDIYLTAQKIDMITFFKGILPNSLLTESFYSNLNAALTHLMSKLATFISTKFTDTLFNLPNFLLQALIFFFTLFFTMRDAEKLKRYIKNISPFSKGTEGKLLKDFKEITNSVIYGSIVVGILLGIIMGIGFIIFRVPNALILTALAALAAIIPVLGVWIVWVPVALYMLFSGNVGLAVGLAIYSIITTFSLESMIRSYFISKGAKLHSAVGLIGMIGGLFVFGILGLVIGPLLISYFFMILEAYKKKEISSLFS